MIQPKLEFLFVSTLPPRRPVDWHSHDALELVYYAEGEGELWLGEKPPFKFKPRSVQIASAGLAHKQLNVSEMRAICVGVSGSGLEEFDGLHGDDDGRLRVLLDALLVETSRKEPAFEIVAQGLLTQIVGLLKRRALGPAPSKAKPGVVENALRLISEAGGALDLDALSESLYVSKSHLRHLMTRATGKSPLEHIIEKRMEKAASLLLSSNSPLADIAKACGFSDVFYFSKLFKSRFKLPPSAYRKQRGKAQER